MIFFRDQTLVGTGDQLKAIEHEIGQAFPDTFKAYLLNLEARVPFPHTIILNSKISARITNFIAVDAYVKNYQEVVRAYETDSYLPFAECEFGNIFCLKIKDISPTQGEVFLLEHESGTFWPTHKTFSEFIESIVETQIIESDDAHMKVTITEDLKKLLQR